MVIYFVLETVIFAILVVFDRRPILLYEDVLSGDMYVSPECTLGLFSTILYVTAISAMLNSYGYIFSN